MDLEVDLISIDRYVSELTEQLNLSEEMRVIFLHTLTQPLKVSHLESLQLLQTSEIGSYTHFETAQELTSHPVVPLDAYLEIERRREENNSALAGETSIVAESEHIHNKAYFDAVNESLSKFRPYGILGEPCPWSTKQRRLHTNVDMESVDTERLFMLVKQDLFRWTSTMIGTLPS
jgi:hypothetical protein